MNEGEKSGTDPTKGLTTHCRKAPFCFAVWHSPEVLKIISDIAGIELYPSFDYETANINFSINDQNVATVGSGDQASSVAWHYDSVPFVCVVMASDCTGMVGGETAIRLPSGEVRKVRGPSMVRTNNWRFN